MSNDAIENITIIGSGLAGISLSEKIVESGQKIKVNLIDQNDFYFPKNKISINPVNLKEIKKIDKWARQLGINFICDKVIKINEKKKTIFFNNQEEFEYDNLVIATGAVSEKVDIKGTKKEGFFYLSAINPYELKTLLKIYNEAAVFVNTLEGIKFSLVLKLLGAEVRLVAPDLEFLGQEKDKMVTFLAKKGIVVHQGYTLEETIGEKTVKAIKIVKQESESLEEDKNFAMKVFSSQLVFADSGLAPNLNFLSDLEVRLTKEDFFTRYGQIYIIGEAGNLKIAQQKCYLDNDLRAEKEADALANYLLNNEDPKMEAETDEIKMSKGIQKIYDKEEESWQNGLV